MAKTTILVVEDEPDIRDVLEHCLTREGFQVMVAADGADGLKKAGAHRPDLVLLDLMLPEIDGLEVCRRLKEMPATRHVPIIMVSAKGEESDVVLGLGLGADDYVAKPFSPRALIARVQAVLRRSRHGDTQVDAECIVRQGLIIDEARHRVEVDGEEVDFTATELRLLHFLAGRTGRVFTRDQILEQVVGERAVVIGRNVDVHVRAIRGKLGAYRNLLETVRGVGYRFRESAR